MNTSSNTNLLVFTPVCLFFLLIPIFCNSQPFYTPTENIAIDCGSSISLTSPDGRNWIGDGDTNSINSPYEKLLNASETSQAHEPSDVPYSTARIFRSEFTYVFPVTAGPKFLRLHFNPASYPNFDPSKAFFSVRAIRFTLLSNFSAYLTRTSLGLDKVHREFCINVEEDRVLNITFTPSATPFGSYAFINGIEIVSMPTNLYYRSLGLPFIGQQNTFSLENKTALETVYRLNVGGEEIPPDKDTIMFRRWLPDNDYCSYLGALPVNTSINVSFSDHIPNYTAPAAVYKTARSMGNNKTINYSYNLTWNLPVDPEFMYMVRLHFCEFQSEVTKPNDRQFHIFIANYTAEAYADVIEWSGGNGVPTYKDYIVFVDQESKKKRNLSIALHPNPETATRYSDAILNGIEVFKLSDSVDNLAGLNPDPIMTPPPSIPQLPEKPKSRSLASWVVAAIVSGVVCGVAAFSVLGFLIFRRKRKVKGSGSPSLPSDLCRNFSLAEIKMATDNFNTNFIIGRGGFGDVYKGYINGGATPVAIKRLKQGSQQGAQEFMTEIEMLSQLRHLHLVSLIGYCNDDREMVLVYDYMSRGTLRDHLYGTDHPPLPWKQRLEICLGAARGLHYLHAGAKHRIIHRDVKTTNILLDEKWVAKVSDFGLSKLNPTDMSNAHISTVVKGSFGYLDPEYARRQQLTEKSDVYSFGVVLFEVLCARPPIYKMLGPEQVSLAKWARRCYENGTLDQIVDRHLTGMISPECLKKFTEIAVNCLHDEGIKRPLMNDVVWSLEFALQLQESEEEGINFGEVDIELKGKDVPNQDRIIDDRDGHVSSRGVTATSSSGMTSINTETEVLLSSAASIESGMSYNCNGTTADCIRDEEEFLMESELYLYLLINTLPSTSMPTFTLYLSFFLHLIFLSTTTTAKAPPPPYSPTEYFLLNCGSSSTTNSSDGRNWDGDASSKFSPSNIADTSLSSIASEQDPSVTLVPYMTARIFNSQFTYTFPVSAGPKLLRLYFYPAAYSGLDKSQSFFSVAAGKYTLLSNFSAFLTVSFMTPRVASLIKEFIINVGDNQKLNITFSPSSNSFAFVNGIEVVSIPNNLYIRGDDSPITLVGTNSFFYIDNNTALETLYRLNVGGNDVAVNEDTGMFRAWNQDEMYIYGGALGFRPYRNIPIQYTPETPAYTAPEMVYTTSRTMGNLSLLYNLTWIFPVDYGFHYLVRLHFCEIQMEVTRVNQRVFTIFLNNHTAEREADVIYWSGGTGVPVFRDYVVWVPDKDGRRSKQDLWLAMYPNLDVRPTYADAILNGLELFRLNRSDGSFSVPNPELVVGPTLPEEVNPTLPEKTKRKRWSPVVAVAVGVIGGGMGLVIILGFFLFRRCWRGEEFEIKSATSNFDKNSIIGTGGFGKVYKGYIDIATVAIKRLNPSSKQGAREFQTEIEMLSKLRHVHLVSLIGYCDDDGEMILVYDYMAGGTLRDHLYKTENPPLPWKQRLLICIGAARGLHHLHTGAEHIIIHRDVKSTNILLDEQWAAKVSDFGLAKMGPIDTSKAHVSTVVKGSFGYVDPEYFRRQELTTKSDVYSFGVVLFEVLCGRPAVESNPSNENVSLAEWGRWCYRKGTVDRMVDPHLRGQITPECLKKFGEIAVSCIKENGIERPTMNDVLWGLEFALQLQEAADQNNINGRGELGAGNMMDEYDISTASPSPVVSSDVLTTMDDDDDMFSESAEHVSVVKISGASMVSFDGLKTDSFL
ncbi:hypothetical protein F0562_004320 [Nyssa sinensis]|uniref:Protein kinase domain-containing protein n=1 Tax=Nyssa sinensis TaxID=561372 RepID=A0A5J5C2Y5_9ASTE|nr:hypothetical protein F0562_004320 [Nyssa sinensis]